MIVNIFARITFKNTSVFEIDNNLGKLVIEWKLNLITINNLAIITTCKMMGLKPSPKGAYLS